MLMPCSREMGRLALRRVFPHGIDRIARSPHSTALLQLSKITKCVCFQPGKVSFGLNKQAAPNVCAVHATHIRSWEVRHFSLHCQTSAQPKSWDCHLPVQWQPHFVEGPASEAA